MKENEGVGYLGTPILVVKPRYGDIGCQNHIFSESVGNDIICSHGCTHDILSAHHTDIAILGEVERGLELVRRGLEG